MNEALRSMPCDHCDDTGHDPDDRSPLYVMGENGPELGDAPCVPCPECGGMRHPASRKLGT